MVGGETCIDDRYEVEEMLGQGGMADVVRARDAATGDTVAVKLLRLDDDCSHARFRSEIEVLQHLDHPGVVSLLDSGWHDDRPYLVLDLVDGPTLAHLLVGGPLGEERSVAIGKKLAAALAHAHGLGVVHRDVKPSNVLFGPGRSASLSPQLADFGLALLGDSTRVTGAGMCVGTAAYLAPEQLEGHGAAPADIFSLGLVVIECLTGDVCYQGSVAEVALSRLHRSPDVPADLPLWLRSTLRAMTHRDPALRPSADAVAQAFEARSADPLPAAALTAAVTVAGAVTELEVPAPDPDPPPPALPAVRRLGQPRPSAEPDPKAPATAIFATSPSPSSASSSSGSRWSVPRPTRRTVVPVAAAVIALVLSGSLLAAVIDSRDIDVGDSPPAEAGEPPTSTPTTSIPSDPVANTTPTTPAPRPPAATADPAPPPPGGAAANPGHGNSHPEPPGQAKKPDHAGPGQGG